MSELEPERESDAQAAVMSRQKHARWLSSRVGVVASAAVVGIAAGFASILFREAFALIQRLAFGRPLADDLGIAAQAPLWLRFALPGVGGLAIGVLTYVLIPGRRPHGVADVIEAGWLRGGQLSPRVGIASACVSALSIGSGASVGREGPMVHLGATLGSWLTQRLGLEPRWMRRMLACGAAAGVAASFNAPIAGAIFAAEVVVGRYTLHTFAPIVIASVAGTIVSRLRYGEAPGFSVPAVTLTSYWEIAGFVLVGLAGAVAAIGLIRSIAIVAAWHERLGVHPVARPMLGGLVVGLVAIAFPQVLGVGYETTSLAISGDLTIALALALTLAKIVATGASLGSGFGGGIFSPALLVGAALGSAAGSVAALLFPDLSAGPTAYALVGMGAVAAATLGAPLSTTLIVFELTGNYPVTLAVMLATVLASVLVNEVWGYSYFSWQLLRRGIDLSMRRVDALLTATPLEPIASDSLRTVPADLPVKQVPFGDRNLTDRIAVVDEQGRPVGTASASLVRAALAAGAEPEPRIGELELRRDPCLDPGANLSDALALLRTDPVPALLLRDAASADRLWLVTREDVMRAYHGVLDRVHAEDRGDFRDTEDGA
jgi:chloride channel protein, CIC family